MLPDIKLQCLATQAPVVTTIKLAEGWSQATRAPCIVVEAFNDNQVATSVTVSRPYPQDCIALPEPPALPALILGLAALVYWERARL